MNTHEGYSKKTISNANVLLAGGGDKSLADFLGGIRISASKIQYTTANAVSWTDLITLVNTDENVKQTPKTDNVNRPLMMINGGTSAGELTSTSMFSTGIYANASTKTIYASIFNGTVNRTGSSVAWVNGRTSALLRETSSTGYHALWSLKTTNGSWDFGEYSTSGWYNTPVLTYITDANFNAGSNSTTYQIKFPLASGIVALTSQIPTVNNASLTLQTAGTTQTTFYANDSTNRTFNVTNALLENSISWDTVTISNTGRRFVRGFYNSITNLNNFAQYGHAVGMENLADNGSVDNPGGGKGWHHVFLATWLDTSELNGSTSNEWCTQIANACGSTDLWVRSRNGGSISNGTAWKAPWTRILTGSNWTSVITLPTVNNATLTLQVAGITKTTFYANDSTNRTFNVTLSDLGGQPSGNYVPYDTSTARATVDGTNSYPHFYNLEGDNLISGYLNYWHVINLGKHTGNNYASQIAMNYQAGISDTDMFIRTAKGTTWRKWRRVLHDNNWNLYITCSSIGAATSDHGHDALRGHRLGYRHLDAGPKSSWSDSRLYIGYNGFGDDDGVTNSIGFYRSTGTGTYTRTLWAEINSNGLYALTRFGVNGQNTGYNFYVNGTGYITGETWLNSSIYIIADPGISLLQSTYGLRSDYTSVGYPTEEYLKAWTKYAYAKAPGRTVLGFIVPNSRGYIFADVYASGLVTQTQIDSGGSYTNATLGLPVHITGRYYPHGGSCLIFGTSYGVWYLRTNIDSNNLLGYYWANLNIQSGASDTQVPSFGAIRMNGVSSTGTNYITGTAGRIYFGGNFHIDSLGSNATFINHYTANNVYMVSGSSQGNVGIGTSSVSYKFQVNAAATSSNHYTIARFNNASSHGGIEINSGSASTNPFICLVVNGTQKAEVGYSASSGRIYLGNYNTDIGWLNIYSDRGNVTIGDTEVLSTSWGNSNLIVGKDTEKAVIGQLASSTNGVVFGAHNQALSAWAPVNLAGTIIYFRNNESIKAKILDGCLSLFPSANSCREGLRIHSYGSWSDILLCGNDATGDSGTSANSWFLGNNNGNFYITRNGSSSGSSWLANVSNIWYFNNRLSIDTTGRVYPYSTSTRRAGMYGSSDYDSTKLSHIWSIETGYMISDDGLSPGNIYGLAYFHTNWSNDATYNAGDKTAVGTYAGNHQVGWFIKGVLKGSIGNYVWSNGGFIKGDSSDSYVLLGGGGHKLVSDFLTSQDHYKTSPGAGTAGTSSATSGSTLAVPYVTVNAYGHVTGYGTHTHTISGFLTGQDHYKTSPTAGTAGTSSATSGSTLAVPYVTVNANGHVTGYGTHTHTVTGFLTTAVVGSSATATSQITAAQSDPYYNLLAGSSVIRSIRFVAGTGITISAATNGSITITNSAPGGDNTDINVKVNHTNPTSGDWYYPTWYTSTSGTGLLNANNGFRYYTLLGTTSDLGHSVIQVGNSAASGTDGNKRGRVRIFSENTGRVDLYYANTTSNTDQTFPSTSGTILNTGTTSFTLVLTSGTKIGTIKINGTSTDIFAPAGSDGSAYVKKVGDTMTGNLIIDNGKKGVLLKNSDVEYARYFLHTVGTASAQGYAITQLGNSTATGTANNAAGILRLYATNSYYTQILAQGNGSNTFYLPNYDGDMYAVHTSGNTAVGSSNQPVYIAANGRVTACSTMALSSHTHDRLDSQGNLTPEQGRTSARGGVYTYNVYNDSTYTPYKYMSVIGFGRNTAGHVEVASSWINNAATGGIFYRWLRNKTDDWSTWRRIYDDWHDIVPGSDNTYNLGSPTAQFKEIYFTRLYLFGRYPDNYSLYNGRGAASFYSGTKGDIEGDNTGTFLRMGLEIDPWLGHANTVSDIGVGNDYMSMAAYCLPRSSSLTNNTGKNPYGAYIHFPEGGKFFITTGSVICRTARAVYFKLEGSGDNSYIGMYVHNVAVSSDRRIKENIESIPTSDLEDLYNWSKNNFKQFNFIGLENKSYGVIAQDIEEILPEVVKTETPSSEDDVERDIVVEPEHFDEETGELIPAVVRRHIPNPKHLDYNSFHNKLFAALINEIEKLKAEVSELKRNQNN